MKKFRLLNHHVLLHMQVLKIVDHEFPLVPVGKASVLFILFPEEYWRMLFYRAVACWAKELLKPGGLVMAEINESLGLSVKAVFADMGFENVLIVKDLFGKDRFVRCWNSQ